MYLSLDGVEDDDDDDEDGGEFDINCGFSEFIATKRGPTFGYLKMFTGKRY